MAKIFPPRFPFPNQPGRAAELAVYQACSKLDESWTVLFGVSWKHPKKLELSQGEADFILMHPIYGIHVAEVKGGQQIGIRDGQWYSKPHGSTQEISIKDPSLQAGAGAAALNAFLREHLTGASKRRLYGTIGKLVVFPGHRQRGPLGINLPREMICDRNDLTDLERTLRRSAKYQRLKTTLRPEDISKIKEMLMLSLDITGSHHPEFVTTRDQLDLLTDIQLQTFSLLRRLKELTVLGGAGTGKTVLAFHRAQELANQGLSTLYLVSSPVLAAHLRAQITQEALCKNLHIFSEADFLDTLFVFYCEQQIGDIEAADLQAAKNKNDLSRLTDYAKLLQTFHGLKMEDVLELAVGLSSQRGTFEAMVIDEAQLISAPHADLALAQTSTGSPMYIFGDPNQNYRVGDHSIWGQPWVSALDYLGAEDPEYLTINCRSTRSVSTYANSFAIYSSAPIGIEGPEPELYVGTSEQWLEKIEEIVARWVSNYGLEFSQITLLVEDYRLFEDLWGISETPSSFPPLDNRVTFHESFAIDWRGQLNTLLFTRHEIDLLTKSKSYLGNRLPRPEGVSFKAHYGNLDPFIAVGRHPGMRIDPDPLNQAIADHNRQLENLDVPVIRALPLRSFVGLESDAVIVLNPVFDPGQSFDSYKAELYAMTSRARVLLAVIFSEGAFSLFEQPE